MSVVLVVQIIVSIPVRFDWEVIALTPKNRFWIVSIPVRFDWESVVKFRSINCH